MKQVEKFNLFRWFDTTTFGKNCINSVAAISYKRTIYCLWIQSIKIHKWENLRSLIPFNPEQDWTFSFDQFSHTKNIFFHEYWWNIGEVITCLTKALWHHNVCISHVPWDVKSFDTLTPWMLFNSHTMWHANATTCLQWLFHVFRLCFCTIRSGSLIWWIFHIFTIAFKWNWRQADMFSNLGEPSQTVSQFWQSSQFYLPKGANQPALWESDGRKNNWSCDLRWGFDFSK